MQRDYGIGVDCSGFARRVLARIRGGRQPKGFENDPGMMGSLNIKTRRNGAPHPGWTQVNTTELRTGDVIIFADYSAASGAVTGGHKTVVYSHDVVRGGPEEAGGLRDGATGHAVPLEAGDTMHAITVFASWGASGVDKQTWYYSEGRGQWFDARSAKWVSNPYSYETYQGYREK